MRWVLALQHLDLVLSGSSSVNHFGLHFGQMLGESQKFVLDLISQLPSVAQNEAGVWLWLIVKLLEDRQDEHCGLSHSRLRLAENVLVGDGVGNALLLDLGGMLEATVGDGPVQFALQQEVLEASGKHARVDGLLLVVVGLHCWFVVEFVLGQFVVVSVHLYMINTLRYVYLEKPAFAWDGMPVSQSHASYASIQMPSFLKGESKMHNCV